MATGRDDKPTAIDKALALLVLLGERARTGPLRLSEIVELTGYSKPTAHRLLTILREHGFVSLDPETHRYELGAKVLVLASQYRGSLDPAAKALPALRALAHQASATVHMGILDGIGAVYIEKVESDQSIRLASHVGQRAPLHCSGIGKVLLAHAGPDVLEAVIAAGLDRRTPRTLTCRTALCQALESVRTQGFALDDQEHETGIRCVAAPIRDHRGEVVAAISISGTLDQVPQDTVDGQVGRLLDAARGISAMLGFPGDHTAVYQTG